MVRRLVGHDVAGASGLDQAEDIDRATFKMHSVGPRVAAAAAYLAGVAALELAATDDRDRSAAGRLRRPSAALCAHRLHCPVDIDGVGRAARDDDRRAGAAVCSYDRGGRGPTGPGPFNVDVAVDVNRN